MPEQLSHDPYRDETFARYPALDASAVETAIGLAAEAQAAWANVPLGKRLTHLRDLVQVLGRNQGDWARLATREMGKPLEQARSEVAKCARLCRHYSDEAAGILAPRAIQTEAKKSYVRHDPLGLVLAVMPWNYPFWQVFRCAVPAIIAGNGVVLKHASNVPGCAMACEAAFREAGFPEHLFTTLLMDAQHVAGAIAHPAVQAISLTGSEDAGSAVAAHAGKHLKPCVLELGGSDPFLVLADADMEVAVSTAVQARLMNNGQSCIAAKRFLVEESVADAFLAQLCEQLETMHVGDPLLAETHVGPLAKPAFADVLNDQVDRSIAAGAKRVFKGKAPRRKGFFAPMVLDGVQPGMAAFDEELFGPVFAVVRVADADQAVALANASAYGLGASVWTADTKRAEAIAAKLSVGAVFINAMVVSDPRLPFGGVKRSGYGRELAGEGLLAFTNIKSVSVA